MILPKKWVRNPPTEKGTTTGVVRIDLGTDYFGTDYYGMAGDSNPYPTRGDSIFSTTRTLKFSRRQTEGIGMQLFQLNLPTGGYKGDHNVHLLRKE